MLKSTDNLECLFANWQKNPDIAQTIALCDALRVNKRGDLVAVVGRHASRQQSVPALTAAARMYAETGSLDDAQSVLLTAGRIAPHDGGVYRLLGEVLLRRGDAQRAEKVFERALQLGTDDPTTNAWLERARVLGEAQRSSGMVAVAEAIRRELSAESSSHAHVEAASEEGDEDEGVATQVRRDKSSEVSETRPSIPGRRPKMPPPRLSALDAGAVEEAFAKAFDEAPEPVPLEVTEERWIPPEIRSAHGIHDLREAAEITEDRVVAPQTGHVELPAGAPVQAAAVSSRDVVPVSSRKPAQIPAAPPVKPQAPAARVSPPLSSAASVPLAPPPGAIPDPRDVLDALQIAGVFEPEGLVRPQPLAWDRPAKGKRRIGSYATLVAFAAVMVGGAIGTRAFVENKRAKQHLESEKLLAEVDQKLRASDANDLEPSERAIGSAFDLESRSPHAALTWLHERAMTGLLKGGEHVAFEDGTARAREVGVDDKHVAFTHAASFLFQGDTAGAAAALAKWNGKADDDPWFHLIAGATFERAGDSRAVEHYSAATKLDPDLVIAQSLLIRATALDGDPIHAAELARDFRAKYPHRSEGAALITLAWARDPLRGEPPPEVKEIATKEGLLPSPLAAVAPAARALLAVEERRPEEVSAALKKGLAVVDTPGVAVWLGTIALATGDAVTARKAALTAVSYSAVHPPARMLAARVALLGSRLDEAIKAAEELPPTSMDVGIITAAVAYEKLDAERMSRALDGLSAETKKAAVLLPLVRGQALLAGNAHAFVDDKAALNSASSEAPWADLVAMDAALDTGDLETARKLASTWTSETTSMRAVRLARLARWDGKLDDADRLSRLSFTGGATVTMRALAERVLVLVARNKFADALGLFKEYPNVGGANAKWLRAYALASSGKTEEARAMIAQEDAPPALAPLPSRTYAALAFGSVKDTRKGSAYVKAIAQAGFANPDVVVAAERVGAKVVRHR